MKNTVYFLLGLSFFLLSFMYAVGQEKKRQPLYSKNNLVAWCVVPFDKMKRNPEQRAAMMKELGITQLAWDWRDEHLPLMEEEIKTLRKNNIKLKSVWFWVNGGEGKVMDEANHFILKTLKDNNVKTELWLSFNDRYFEGLSDSGKLTKAVSAVGEINRRAREIGCTVHLYNHGSWFGEPENQVRIIEALGTKNIGIVYNFHHARHQVNEFPRLLQIMKPYLSTVNINGMKDGGPMIVTVGQGNRELTMLQQLKDSGYQGSIGVLSHVDDEDAKVVLARNLEGLKMLLKKMGDSRALKTY
ncbi:MAG TPA: xylose isomerase [Chryseosolibacter sp.]|nr:xylose isomerase [Chryseosolibacter sp.]